MTSHHRTRKECLAWFEAHPKAIAPRQDVVVDRFKPEDAEGVARLYHAVYGDAFPIEYVYDPARIQEANLGPDLHQIVARTQAGDVVGLSALFRVAPGKGILESGALMILPEYRLGTLIFRLIDLTQKMAEDELQLNAVFGQSVTDHLTTQKINRTYGFQPFAFEIESMPPRPDGDGARISLLDEFRVLRDSPHDVYLPHAYASFLRDIYAERGLERSFRAGTGQRGETVWETQSMGAASLAKVMVTEVGADFPKVLQGLETAHPGCHAYQLQLPLWHPGLPWAVEEARERGYCLGGLLPLWADRDVLLMQKVAGEPDFTVPRILTEQAKALVACIRADRESLK
ncbi:MAG: GNAT family N-acetyltransferase [Pseudodesulfovibrio sp.]|uniref:N-acetyltransferase domain-containing protein n=1 Tax=Pseudodesulfovibrio aespoeensis (strain ATCC 700646 / DSM 10631 / Aspo-2) TaxID=643562 RepID=E6VRU2_PSEA9|nr:hypothetical protein [Pseudodesulfovibrio aespoeensis]ADU64229.1 hypothetical protein Daes_3240 [Pseudodesulfovibrio aespoeensis Aspo-2]MBU4243027.1 GNAT family N-acetyltransferase [Pseudomonadota bacterium]MBV1766112.1 GNAT family N-acetyltransferase [Pseudodesulfovibrio sp.]MBU4380278.1 GNAT family N-acetyltransferase [Pseudomonadota bacterium]MBU4474854.1 GNAT family N-acetyltransferase [Pseudomonadota bacterium]